MSERRTRRVRGLAYLIVGLLLAAMFGVRVTSARADNSFGSYTVLAAAPGFEFTEDEPSAQGHPEGQGALPYTTSLLTTGDYGYSLSSVAWPGAYGGNAGSLILVALPSEAGGVAIPDAVRDGVKTVAPALQYPIRAEARAGSTPDASYTQIPGTTLTSHADPANALGEANVQGASQPGTATYGNLHSKSNSVISSDSNASTAKATAESLVQDINIGGVVKIKAVTSTAIADSKGNASGATVVQGMEIAGQKVYLDDKGLQIGEPGKPQNTNVVVAQAVNQALSQLGMKFYVSQPHGENANGATNYDAGSVVMNWKPPSNPAANVFTLTLGGATVSVATGAGFGTGGGDVAAPAADAGGTAGSDTTGALGVDQGGGSTTPLDTGVTPATPSVGGGTGSTGASTSLAGSQSLAATFEGIGAGWLLLALGAAVLLGLGSRRLITDLLDRSAATTCPLEVRR